MGSFDFTCCVSNLPIRVGDRVKYLLLTENPYTDNNLVCYPTDKWFPRTPPLRAKYNDYGSIDSYDEGCPAAVGITEGLKWDLIEVGVGDNTVHDVAAKKGMSLEATLDAVWEKRVKVERSFAFKPWWPHRRIAKLLDQHKKNEITSEQLIESLEAPPKLRLERDTDDDLRTSNDRLPTLARVEDLLRAAGFQIGKCGFEGGDFFLVDEQDVGWVRVRSGNYEPEMLKLEKAVTVLKSAYSAMITAGTGNYAFGAEIQVMPKYSPDRSVNFLSSSVRDSKEPLFVYQAMILEEVWDKLLEPATTDLEKARKSLQKEWEATIEGIQSFSSNWDYRNPVPYSMGINEHLDIIAGRHLEKPFTAQQISEFLDDVAGMLVLPSVLYEIRYWWRPSFSCGPQFGEYAAHKRLYQSFAELCDILKTEEEP